MRRRPLAMLACAAALACAEPGEAGESGSSDSDSGEVDPGDGDPGDGDPGDGDPGDGDPGDGDPGDGDPGDGDPGDGDPGDGDGDGDELRCDPQAFIHAPPPTVVDNVEAVAIDILDLDAALSFDVDDAAASASVVMTFQVGPDPGDPLFDLRQQVDSLVLDGQPIDSNWLARHDFGKGWLSGFMVLDLELAACSIHTLEFEYSLQIPAAPGGAGLDFQANPARLRFDLWMSDLNPGRYLESWLPANMPWDRHPIHVGLSLADAGETHELISNGEIEAFADHDWQIEFPASTTAFAPMILVVPSSSVAVEAGIHETPSGQDVAYWVWVDASLASPPATHVPGLLDDLDDFVRSTGEYPYPGLIAWLFRSNRSMEYAGGTTSTPAALGHEVFHSFWARGLEPATYADGWIDEAWTMFNTQPGVALIPAAFDWGAPAVELRDPHPFARTTPLESYATGRVLFAGLAELLGLEPLRESMANFYAAGPVPRSITTAELERHLYCENGELPEIRQAFHRFVHGQRGQAPAPANNYCS